MKSSDNGIYRFDETQKYQYNKFHKTCFPEAKKKITEQWAKGTYNQCQTGGESIVHQLTTSIF